MTRGVSLVLGSFAVAVAAAAGCVTEVRQDDRRAARRVSVDAPPAPEARPPAKAKAPAARAPAPVGPEAVDKLTANEPCANRLHALAGDMLLYFAIHRRLPAALDDLRTISDAGATQEFTCPTSGRPYVYVPTGLTYPGKDERLVLYDAEPAHDGARWGIVAAPPKGERPAATWAVRLPEELFRAYSLPPPAPLAPAPVEPPRRRPRTPRPLN